MSKNTTVIAVTGKGGVGKTSISAAMVRELVRAFPDKRVLAIDADPAVGLSTALGIVPTSTVDDIRKNIIENVEEGKNREAIELLGEARYRIFDAMTEKDGFCFIAVGRPEAAGCYCKVNSYLKEVIALLSDDFDYVVIDGEAGIEQVNRRVMEKVTHLVLITDPSKKGADVVKTIVKVADGLVMYQKAGVIVNRLTDLSLAKHIDLGTLKAVAYIPEDKNLAAFDLTGRSVFELPEDSAVAVGAREALKGLGIL